MNNDFKNEDGKKERKPSKGFFAAIILSLALVGAACFFAARQSDNLDEPDTQVTTAVRVTTTAPKKTTAAPVAKPQTSIPKNTTVVKSSVPVVATTVSTQEVVTVVSETKEVIANEDNSRFAPVGGEVLNEFSNGELVKSKTTGAWQTHNGTDFLATPGESVLAIKDGTISAVDNDALWGVVVTIDHGNGIVGKYCGLNENVPVEVGAVIKGGSEVGTIGNSSDIESSEECHLHLELKENGRYLDPVTFINN